MLCYLAEGLAERGHAQSILSLSDSSDKTILDRLSNVGVEVRTLGKRILLTGFGLHRAFRWLKVEEFDVVITMLFVSDVIGRPLARLAGIKFLVSSIRARNIHYAYWQRKLVRATMRLTDVIVLNSERVRTYAIQVEGASADKITIIPNGVRVQRVEIKIDPVEIYRELGIPQEGTLIGSVGRLTHQKGFDVLLQAFAQVKNEDLHLLIIGTGEEKETLQAQAKMMDIDENIHFVGYRNDVPELLQVIQLYIQPSRFEGMPNALLEAMAAGCPIIASDVDGICELIEDGEHGWLVPAENEDALVKAIEVALGDPVEGKRRGLNSKKLVQEKYSLEAMIDAWDQLLVNRGINL